MTLSELLKITEIINSTSITEQQKTLEVNSVKAFRSLEIKQDALIFISQKTTLPNNAKPGVIITTPQMADFFHSTDSVILQSNNPRLAFAKISNMIAADAPKHDIHKSAKIHKSTVIEQGVKIGQNSKIDANCTIYGGTVIGENVKISAGSVIGSGGFGSAMDDNGVYFDIKHLGGVKIDNKVTIGANTTIDKATLNGEFTHLESGVKIDNLVHIAHNVHIQKNTVIAAKTGIAGSVKLGENCQIGGMCAIFQGIQISNQVILTPTSFVHKNIEKSGAYFGNKLLKTGK
jgi:UDP-3-O-[3-hydroxymyristoyl] glucosamine N-acyltransferase